MKLTRLRDLLDQRIPAEVFLRDISGEVGHASTQMKRQGSIVPIHVVEDVALNFTTKDLATLLRLCVSGAISPNEMDYIGSCLELCEAVEFQNGIIAEYIFEFSTQDINGLFTVERAQEILTEIERHLTT